jgi:phosphohistidine phosphatase
MQIYVLRHAIAEDRKPGQQDSERPLTGEGRAKLHRVLERAHAAQANPSLIISSPFRRAVETAEAAAKVLRYPGKIVRSRTLEPDCSPYSVWEEIRALEGESAILLASHEPLVSSLVAFLLGCPALQVEMKKSALVRVDVAALRAQPTGTLKWMLTPALAED